MRKFLTILVAVMILFGSMSKIEAKTKMTDYEAINNLIISERLYRVSHRDKELAGDKISNDLLGVDRPLDV